MNVGKEMLLRMIARCKKVRTHKPKKVEVPVLKIEGSQESVDFPEKEIKLKKWKTREETSEVRKSLRNLV